MSIIDFRVRPYYKNFGKGFPAKGGDLPVKFGYENSDGLQDSSLEALVKEFEENDVVKAVIPGRVIPNATNEELFELGNLYPDKFIIYPFLDAKNPEKSLNDIDEYIINGNGKGVALEPYIFNEIKFDDPSLFPIYKKLEENHIPLMETVNGWVGPYIDNSIPRQIDHILTKFTHLVFIAAHAVYPFFGEIVAVAAKHPNLYLTADFEGVRGPGWRILRDGTIHMVKNQVIFASSYPFGPVGDTIETIRQEWKLPKDIEEKVFYENAAKVLGL